MVKVNGCRVLGQQGEPRIICGGDSAPKRMLVHVANFKVLEEAASPALFCGHRWKFLLSLDCAFSAQSADLLIGVSDGAENLFGVFAHRRNRVHARLYAAHDDWRQQGSDRPVGRVNLSPAVARGQLWM